MFRSHHMMGMRRRRSHRYRSHRSHRGRGVLDFLKSAASHVLPVIGNIAKDVGTSYIKKRFGLGRSHRRSYGGLSTYGGRRRSYRRRTHSRFGGYRRRRTHSRYRRRSRRSHYRRRHSRRRTHSHYRRRRYGRGPIGSAIGGVLGGLLGFGRRKHRSRRSHHGMRHHYLG